MIARISGTLEEIVGGTALVNPGSGLWYEVLIPAFDAERLAQRIGQEVILHTIHYIEGDPAHGAQTPRLLGFLVEIDRGFFRVFTTVKGIGIKKALRALVKPVAEVASAIQAKDARFLVQLPEIGKRTAEQIIAELNGKIDEYAGPSVAVSEARQMSDAAQEALAVLVQLGERHADAAALVERVLVVAPETQTPEAIIQYVYRLKAGGK